VAWFNLKNVRWLLDRIGCEDAPQKRSISVGVSLAEPAGCAIAVAASGALTLHWVAGMARIGFNAELSCVRFGSGLLLAGRSKIGPWTSSTYLNRWHRDLRAREEDLPRTFSEKKKDDRVNSAHKLLVVTQWRITNGAFVFITYYKQ